MKAVHTHTEVTDIPNMETQTNKPDVVENIDNWKDGMNSLAEILGKVNCMLEPQKCANVDDTTESSSHTKVPATRSTTST